MAVRQSIKLFIYHLYICLSIYLSSIYISNYLFIPISFKVVPRLLTPESDYHTSGEENMSADSPPPPPPPPEVRFPRQSSASTSYTPRQTPLAHSRQTPSSQSAPALRPRTYTSVPAVVISGDEMGAADSWGEGDKDSGEEISCSSGGEDMDTSLSSSGKYIKIF